ncbi:MAG TPA: pentapeptide repeat-containing protein [Acidimicrobiales bacterium]|nr:pentapeptide repeat-containing protein [Acidimicrobiales bacterium]
MPGYDPAPDELVDDDVWSMVEATGDYVGQRAEGIEMGDVVVRGGRWSGAVLEGLRAFDVTFEDCDLSGLTLHEDPVLQTVTFRRCRLDGATFAGARLRDVRFEGCAFGEGNLRMLDAERVTFDDTVLTGADFHAAKLHEVRVENCDLRGSDWTKARLQSVDLRGSRLEDLRGADALRGATVDSAQVVSLALSFAVALGLNVVDDDSG